MADFTENEFDLEELDKNIQSENAVEQRIRTLSGKTKEAYEARDASDKAKAEAEERAVTAEKERDFLASFSDSTAKYPGANEYRDAIKEKVMAGYSVEDATVAVLAHEGKFSPEPAEKESPLGGSAINQPDLGGKATGEMTRDEMREALMDAEKRGDLSV